MALENLTETMDAIGLDEDDLYNSWYLTATPVPVLVIVGLYLIFVLKIGPKYMENREPYKLTGLMMCNNVFQIAFNGFLCAWLVLDTEGRNYLISHMCHPLDYRKNPLRVKITQANWLYLFLKVTDLSDTIFMVLRKKFSHVTFLHLYHHSAMVLCSWFCIKYIKEMEQAIFPGVINAFVHVIMYSYYFLAAFGPNVKKYLWWKRYLTRIQISQFLIVIAFWGYLFTNDCQVSQAYNILWIVNVFIILVLFTNFYIRTYILKPRAKEGAVKKSKKDE